MSRLPFLARGSAVALALLAGAACVRQPAPEAQPEPQIQPVTAPRMTPPTIDRSSPPRLGEVKPLRIPTVQERTLANGLRILVVEHRELPVVDAILVVRTGAEANPPNHAGLASVVAQMLKEGTRTRSALEIADQEAFLGVSLNTSSGWDASTISLHAPVAVLDSALALFADVALSPTFPIKELDRVRRERLTDLLQLRDRPAAIANLAYNSLLFGERHPYGRPIAGTEASMQRITRGDIRRFYGTFYRPNNATLIVVGDVSADDVAQRAERLFGRWARGNVPTINVASAAAPQRTTIYMIDKPNAPQSSIRVGTVGVARATEDYFPILVMNTILGDAFTSRLNMTLRERRGFTYGARSTFAMRRAAGPFVAQAEVTAAKTDSSLMEFMNELRGIRDTLPTAEIEKAKRYLQLQLPNEFETTRDIADKLTTIALHDLPLSYYDNYAQAIGAVTQTDVRRVAQRYVTPENLVVVVVGDRKAIEQGVRSAGVGDVEIRDINGQPLPNIRPR